MTVFTARPVSKETHILAEGPVWTGIGDEVIWVDLERGQVFEGRFVNGLIEQSTRHDFDGTVGAVVKSVDGHLLVAGQHELVVVTPSGERITGPRIIADQAHRRTNDGACDPAGRFLIGTLSLDNVEGGESLVRIEDDATSSVIDDNLTLSNGLAWSPDGTLLYSTDTVPGIIWVRDYDAVSGSVGQRRQHLAITGGFPDGLCVDSLGFLWVAIWGASEIRSFAPDGAAADTVEVAAPHPSSVAFIGEKLDTLLITTASRDLSAEESVLYPDAGRLFTADVGVTGTATFPWSGSWLGT